jgi:hypothetical protein
VAGSGKDGTADGTLQECRFRGPYGMCWFGDSLIVADYDAHTIRSVEGVLRVDAALTDSLVTSEYEARAVPLMMTAVPVLPKELARLMAQYARPFGTHTIAGLANSRASADGPALSGTQATGTNHRNIGGTTTDRADGDDTGR